MVKDVKYVTCKKEGTVVTLCIDNPPVNALKNEVLKDLEHWVDALESDNRVRTVILTGKGKSFVAGADIKEFIQWTADSAEELTRRGQGLFTRIENLRMPTIAAINGFALGGGLELALACDIRIASEKAKFGVPETSLGIIPAYGGTTRLPRVVGSGWAKRMIFTAEMIDAHRALQIGLVQEIAAPEELEEKASELAFRIASNAPGAIGRAKKAINRNADMSQEECLLAERKISAACFAGKEKKEGVAAFIEKRTPDFGTE